MGLTTGQLQTLSVEECLDLLARHDVGRLAVVVDGQPVIFPVNYLLDGRTIIFRNDPGSKLAHASFDRVAFEIDEIDPARREGWSVVVQGLGMEFTDALDEAAQHAHALGLSTWVTGEKGHWVRILSPTITGRRLHQPAEG